MEDNLSHLSGEFVFNYIVDTALPAILQERCIDLGNNEFTTIKLIEEHRLTKLSLSTVY